MALKYVVPVNIAAVWDGTNPQEMCDVANMTGIAPFTVKSNNSGQLVITCRGWDLTFQLGDVMLGTSAMSQAYFEANWAEVTPIDQQ